ncbi:hypothetical protein PR001_g25265 [Phytophthora rubi]|uniref:Uncharacterized protein n=1 Tax=Phytophthora rubi TaxID=129364 RepID=A0A6A3IAD8_9STRA|nr:hypothetical protein PR001_g25265 [Phytophthora rubi]
MGFSYKKRDHFNKDPVLIRHRLNKKLKYDLIPIGGDTQLCCIVCCQLNHDIENVGHSRKGYKTRYQRSDCEVALCRVARWNGELSCYEKFHSDKELQDPCLVSDQLISAQKHGHRAQPPSRKRPHMLAIPNRRASSTRLQPPEHRRSLRLREQQRSEFVLPSRPKVCHSFKDKLLVT